MKFKTKIDDQTRHAAFVEDAVGGVSLCVLLFAWLGFTGPF
jgi:hypothetical protein